MYSLVVIDMQPGFLTFYKLGERRKIIKAVKKQVEQAVKDGVEIVDVRFKINMYGKTHTTITKLWRDYDNVKCVEKFDNDGGDQILEVTKNEPLRICGINLSACVEDTVRTINDTNTPFFIIKNAVANPDSWGHGYRNNTFKHFRENLIDGV